MFSSKSKDQASTPAAAPVPAKRTMMRSGAAPSIISHDVVLVGTLTSTGDIQIDGRIDGDVRSAGLVIGEKAQINGEILADDVTIRGHVHGRVRARKVLLCSTSHVEGDILHEAFAVEAGAFFEGNCRHSDNPLGEEMAAKKPMAEMKSVQAEIKPAPSASAAPMASIVRPAVMPAVAGVDVRQQ